MYKEFKPSQALKSHVECLWISKNDKLCENKNQRIIPDGCIDLIFNLTPGNESAYWVGTMTKSFILNGSKPSHYVGIRFKAGGAKTLLTCPMTELTDAHVPIEDITPTYQKILDSLVLNSTCSLLSLDQWLNQMPKSSGTHPLIQTVLQKLKVSTHDLNVSQLSSQLGISRQYLNRIAKEHIGVDLKTFQRILRMHTLVESLKSKQDANKINWSEMAQDFGFYDQSHLIHDFKDLNGITPNQFFQN
jgi:AraC-like DNA-binding protein